MFRHAALGTLHAYVQHHTKWPKAWQLPVQIFNYTMLAGQLFAVISSYLGSELFVHTALFSAIGSACVFASTLLHDEEEMSASTIRPCSSASTPWASTFTPRTTRSGSCRLPATRGTTRLRSCRARGSSALKWSSKTTTSARNVWPRGSHSHHHGVEGRSQSSFSLQGLFGSKRLGKLTPGLSSGDLRRNWAQYVRARGRECGDLCGGLGTIEAMLNQSAFLGNLLLIN